MAKSSPREIQDIINQRADAELKTKLDNTFRGIFQLGHESEEVLQQFYATVVGHGPGPMDGYGVLELMKSLMFSEMKTSARTKATTTFVDEVARVRDQLDNLPRNDPS